MTLALLLALGVAGAGMLVSRRWRMPGQIIMVFGALGLIGVVAVQVRQTFFTPEPKPPSRCDMAVSTSLASYVVRDLAAGGGTVVLLFPDRRVMDAETERSYEEGFTLALRHGPRNLQLKALHLEAAKGKAGYDLAAFTRVLEQAGDVQAIVSYAGAPPDFDTFFAAQAKRPLFYVFDPDGGTHWLGALKAGHVRAVIVPKPGVSAGSREGVTGAPQDIFEQFYLLATPQTADQVAAQLSKK